MAKVTLENNTERQIHLNIGKEKYIVPSAKENPDDRQEIVNGTLEIDFAVVEEARKHPVATHYFKQGWLKVINEPADEPKKTGK